MENLYQKKNLLKISSMSGISWNRMQKYFNAITYFKLLISYQRKHPTTTLRPMYFRMLTLVAFHVFLTLKVMFDIREARYYAADLC